MVTMFLRPYLLSRKFGAIFSKHLCNSAIVPLKNSTIVEIAGEILKTSVEIRRLVPALIVSVVPCDKRILIES